MAALTGAPATTNLLLRQPPCLAQQHVSRLGIVGWRACTRPSSTSPTATTRPSASSSRPCATSSPTRGRPSTRSTGSSATPIRAPASARSTSCSATPTRASSAVEVKGGGIECVHGAWRRRRPGRDVGAHEGPREAGARQPVRARAAAQAHAGVARSRSPSCRTRSPSRYRAFTSSRSGPAPTRR